MCRNVSYFRSLFHGLPVLFPQQLWNVKRHQSVESHNLQIPVPRLVQLHRGVDPGNGCLPLRVWGIAKRCYMAAQLAYLLALRIGRDTLHEPLCRLYRQMQHPFLVDSDYRKSHGKSWQSPALQSPNGWKDFLQGLEQSSPRLGESGSSPWSFSKLKLFS